MTHFTVYKTTNVVNNKFYIGCHKTDDPLDDYLGSGTALIKAIVRYGKNSFHKEVIAIFDNSEDMFSLEEALVTDDLLKTSNCYNSKKGGKGGWDHIHNDSLTKAKIKESLLKYYTDNPEAWNKTKSKISQSLKEYYVDPSNRKKLSNAARKAMNRPDVKRKLIAENLKRAQDPLYAEKISKSLEGKIFIHHDRVEKSKRVPKEDLSFWIEEGWKEGRKSRK